MRPRSPERTIFFSSGAGISDLKVLALRFEEAAAEGSNDPVEIGIFRESEILEKAHHPGCDMFLEEIRLCCMGDTAHFRVRSAMASQIAPAWSSDS